jgi:cytidyltransferase-like protein
MFTVYTDMCADLCHYGHFAFIDKMVDIAREVNEEAIPICVVVGIHNDASIESYKRRPIMSMAERCRMISYHPLVSHVVQDAPLCPSLEYLAAYAVRLVCIGPRSDTEMQLMYGHIPASMLKLIPYTDGVSTTDIINRVRSHCMVKDTSIQLQISHTSNNMFDDI